MLTPLHDGLWELNAPLTVFGMALDHRMTVVRLGDHSLWVHSPVAWSEPLAADLARLGAVGHIVAPSCVHDTYLEEWFAAYPQARFYGAEDFPRYRPDLKFHEILGDNPPVTWAGTFRQHVMRGAPRLNETLFLHQPSRTLILTDLCFNLGPDMPFLSRTLLRLNDAYCQFGPSRLLKLVIKDRAAFRTSLDHVLAWDFDRIIVSHGDNLETGGKALLGSAFLFL